MPGLCSGETRVCIRLHRYIWHQRKAKQHPLRAQSGNTRTAKIQAFIVIQSMNPDRFQQTFITGFFGAWHRWRIPRVLGCAPGVRGLAPCRCWNYGVGADILVAGKGQYAREREFFFFFCGPLPLFETWATLHHGGFFIESLRPESRTRTRTVLCIVLGNE